MSLDIDEFMDLDYVTHKEAWDSLDSKEDEMENVSMVNTESEYLSCRISQAQTDGTGGTELDSHADSPVVGKHCYVLRSTGRKVNVRGFSDKLGKPMGVDVVDAVVAYDDPQEGDTHPLVIKNTLHVPSMEINLIPPFMMILSGIEVNECPKFLSEHPTIKNHSILFREENIRIPLQLSNTISYIATMVPVTDELNVMNTPDIKTLYLTPNSPSWNPHNDLFQSQESNMVDYEGNVITSSNPTSNK